jgi:hypothetical protein
VAAASERYARKVVVCYIEVHGEVRDKLNKDAHETG